MAKDIEGGKDWKRTDGLRRLCQIIVSEFLATFFLEFLVVLGCLKVGSAGSDITRGALTSGFAVTTLIATFGQVSDCHMNPAVTAAFWVLGKNSFWTSLVYIAAELCGAVAGAGAVWGLIPRDTLSSNPGLCMTLPMAGMSSLYLVFFEFLLTSVLIFLVCGLCDLRSAGRQDSGPVKFGFSVAGLIYAGGSISGASLNPARSFAPAFWNWNWSYHWAYWVAQMTAGVLVPLLYRFLLEKDYTHKES